jgi:hypothetical protein
MEHGDKVISVAKCLTNESFADLHLFGLSVLEENLRDPTHNDGTMLSLLLGLGDRFRLGGEGTPFAHEEADDGKVEDAAVFLC